MIEKRPSNFGKTERPSNFGPFSWNIYSDTELQNYRIPKWAGPGRGIEKHTSITVRESAKRDLFREKTTQIPQYISHFELLFIFGFFVYKLTDWQQENLPMNRSDHQNIDDQKNAEWCQKSKSCVDQCCVD